MLNIFAEALLIATRLGRQADQNRSRRSPHEFMEIDRLNTIDHLRQIGR
jgi:hypothetical protein